MKMIYCILDHSLSEPRILGRGGKARWFKSAARAIETAEEIYGPTGWEIAEYEAWKYAKVVSP